MSNELFHQAVKYVMVGRSLNRVWGHLEPWRCIITSFDTKITILTYCLNSLYLSFFFFSNTGDFLLIHLYLFSKAFEQEHWILWSFWGLGIVCSHGTGKSYQLTLEFSLFFFICLFYLSCARICWSDFFQRHLNEKEIRSGWIRRWCKHLLFDG